MVLGLLAALFGPRLRLPSDRITRIPRKARVAGRPHADAMLAAVQTLAALPGIADVRQNKRVPKGFEAAVRDLLGHYEAYLAAVRPFVASGPLVRPGEPGGENACYAAPVGVTLLESIHLYRHLRLRRDFPAVATRLATLGERQVEEIKSRYKGKNPEKIRMTSAALQQGRLAFARQKERCPLFDESQRRCSAAAERPLTCRAQHLTAQSASIAPDDPRYPKEVPGWNLAVPVRVRVALAQLEKRLGLQAAPFLYVGIMQVAELAEARMLPEVGEAPLRLQQDGTVMPKANRNSPHAKKFQKGQARQSQKQPKKNK